MKKKFLIFTLIILTVFTLTACSKNKENKEVEEKSDNIKITDGLKFKEEYESLNGVENENNGKIFREVNIPENNPIIYKEASDIIKMIENNESFVVYFGFAKCPWCRSIIETLINVANDYNVDTVYYVDVSDIRDTLKLDEDNNIVTDKEGTEDYMKLIELLDNVLSDYTLTDNDGDKVLTGEKRIYAPNIVAIINGKAEKLETGISDSQEDGYQELTDEILDDSYEKISSVIKLLNENNNCSLDSKC